MADFSIKSKDLIDFTLGLQRINSVALPFAIQDTLNDVARDVKKRTLNETTNKMFDIKRKNFFKSHSGFKMGNAKQSGYDINKIKSEVFIYKTAKDGPKSKAAEQVANQPTASPIKRSINLIDKNNRKKEIIKLLSKKAEMLVWNGLKEKNENVHNYLKKAHNAHKRGAPLIIGRRHGSGSVNIVKTFRKRKPTKANPNRFKIKMENIGSYRKGGNVKLRKKAPFLTSSVKKSRSDMMGDSFIKHAERQFKMAMKRKGK